jgi:hypothetical protein
MSTANNNTTDADRDRADDVAWSMAMEGRMLTDDARKRLLEAIVAARLALNTER